MNSLRDCIRWPYLCPMSPAPVSFSGEMFPREDAHCCVTQTGSRRLKTNTLRWACFEFWESWGHCTGGPTFPGAENPVFEVKAVLGDGTAGQPAPNPAGKPDGTQPWICSFGGFAGISRNPLPSVGKEGVGPCTLLPWPPREPGSVVRTSGCREF